MVSSDGRLAGRVALVTGAGSGFGRSTALRLAAAGAAVACVDLNEAAAAETADQITAASGRAIALSADVSSAADCRAMVENTAREFGEIDVLFANAGVPSVGTAAELDESDWDRVIGVNLKGVWLSAKHVLPGMVRRGRGSIINTASVAGLVGVRNQVAYAAAKGGVIAMTRQMAADFSPYGVRVNAICPSTVITPLVQRSYEARFASAPNPQEAVREAQRQMLLKHPIGRFGTPEDIADLVLFLASDESRWITGTAITIDGGYTAV